MLTPVNRYPKAGALGRYSPKTISFDGQSKGRTLATT